MTELQELLRRWTVDGPVRRNRGRLDVVTDEGGTVPLDVAEISPEEVELVGRWAAPAWWAGTTSAYLPSLRQLADGVVAQRSGLLRAEVEGDTVVLRMTLYLDGASRQTFAAAATEVARAHALLDGATRDLQPQLAAIAEAEREVAATQAALSQAQSAGAVGNGGAPGQVPPAGQAAQAPPAYAPAAPAWRATHRAPPQGLRAWPTPDPNGAVTAIPGNVELQVLTQTGAWAQVAASNGWQGWVDARLLVTV